MMVEFQVGQVVIDAAECLGSDLDTPHLLFGIIFMQGLYELKVGQNGTDRRVEFMGRVLNESVHGLNGFTHGSDEETVQKITQYQKKCPLPA